MSRCCCRRNWSNLQAQAQAQAQAQDQDQDQFLRSVFRDIGNGDVHVEVDNVSVAVAVLLSLGLALGAIEPGALRGYIDQLLAKA